MGRGFIELHDDYGFRYLVNIDKIVNVSVDNKRVWTGEKSSLYICGESYTSLLINNDLGFGYAVCPRCYEAEFREMGESCDL